jgi:hypothetical protein
LDETTEALDRMPDVLVGLLGLAVVITAVVGLWRWSHRDDDVVWVDDGYEYEEVWEEEWYEEER